MKNDLFSLGSGEGSPNEAIKARSNYLRGTLHDEIANPDSGLTGDAAQLLKFHGSYQQEDRDKRRERREAGAAKAHEFMVRSRIPGGRLTAEQYLVHDELARRYGNGTLRLTTRQGIQLHGVLKGDLRATIASINEALLSTLAACGDVNRNVMACPAPARDGAHAVAQAAAEALAHHLAPRTRAYHELWLDGERVDPGAQAPADDEPVYGPTYLPRKFKIAVALADDNCVDAYTQDLAFVAEPSAGRDDVAGYTVLAGGGMGSTHGKRETYPRLASPLCFVRPHELLDAAATIVTIQRDYGDRANRRHARMKYLLEERGTAWFRAELESRLGRAVADPRPVAFPAARDHLGRHGGAAAYLGIFVENGRVADRTDGLMRTGLRTVVERLRPDVRLTPQQNVLLAGLDAAGLARAEAILRDHGVETDPTRLGARRFSMACPALPTCGLAVAEAERALPGIVAEIQAVLDELAVDAREAPGIRMTGCPNGCARPRMGEIGIVGRSAHLYDLFIGGDTAGTRLNRSLAQSVARESIVATLRPFLEAWRARRTPNERFGDFVMREDSVRAAV